MNTPISKLSLDLFLNHLRSAVVIADPEGNIILANTLFRVLFLSHDPKQDQNLFTIFAHQPILLQTINKIIEHRGTYALRKIEISKSPDTQKKPADIEALPLIDDEGTLLGFSLIFDFGFQDQRFNQHQKQVDRIQDFATIASGLAHEIKNPLSGIKGASQLMADSLEGNEEMQEYATMIQQEVNRVDRLLSDLLNFTKPRKLKKKEVNLNKILRHLILLQKSATKKDIEFKEEFDPSLPLIQGDEDSLNQVFLNLIKNACQSIKDSGKVKIRTRIMTDMFLKRGNKKRPLIEISVSDDGPGIPETDLPNVFTPFFTTKAKGSGLGLPVSFQIVSEHDGNIQVKNNPQGGACFLVYLPV